jgi:20S proteasome alpha/beta subunit
MKIQRYGSPALVSVAGCVSLSIKRFQRNGSKFEILKTVACPMSVFSLSFFSFFSCIFFHPPVRAKKQERMALMLLGSLAITTTTTRTRRTKTNMLVVLLLFYTVVILASFCTAASAAAADTRRAEGRYSFSLTTFDPQGKLGQVERAMEAASHGPPIVACVVVNDDDDDKNNGSSSSTSMIVVLAAPQVLPSPSCFMQDDGTRRFVRITDEILVAHSGLSADGRVLLAAAQRLAVEHEYTYDVAIPIDSFLQQLSLLFQQYTMKPGARPFGCYLVVAYMPTTTRRRQHEDSRQKPMICRIDPSGCIEKFDTDHHDGGSAVVVIINGNHLESLTDLRAQLQTLVSSSKTNVAAIIESSVSSTSPILTNDKGNDHVNDDVDDNVPTRIAHLLRSSIREQAKKRRIVTGDDNTTPSTASEDEMTILTASLSSTGQFCMERKL